MKYLPDPSAGGLPDPVTERTHGPFAGAESASSHRELASDMSGICAGRTCVVGVGNRMKADDAAGPILIDRLRGSSGAHLVDAGPAPENFLEKIVRLRPDTVLIVDAIDWGAVPGSIAVFRPEQLAAGGISTHALSLNMVCDYLAARGCPRVALVGIQPGEARMEREPSRSVLRAVNALAGALARVCPRPKSSALDPPSAA